MANEFKINNGLIVSGSSSLGSITSTGSFNSSGSINLTGDASFIKVCTLTSVWSAGGALITARVFLAGAGTQNAGLAFGGAPALSCTEEYNGTSWSAGGALITGRNRLAGAGTQNAGLAFGGGTPSQV